MEQYDSQMAARVWQRVQNRDTDAPDISVLFQAEITDLSRYRQLSGLHGLSGKPEISLLITKTQQCVSILQGIRFLLAQAHSDMVRPPLSKESPTSSLRRCYGSTLRRISQYEQWIRQPEYAPGFLLLSQLSRERCQLLLQILGNHRFN